MIFYCTSQTFLKRQHQDILTIFSLRGALKPQSKQTDVGLPPLPRSLPQDSSAYPKQLVEVRYEKLLLHVAKFYTNSRHTNSFMFTPPISTTEFHLNGRSSFGCAHRPRHNTRSHNTQCRIQDRPRCTSCSILFGVISSNTHPAVPQ